MEELMEGMGGIQTTKTYAFKLIPYGKTLEHIKNDGVLEKDLERNKAYQKAKEFLDEYHKRFIEQTLKGAKFDWQTYFYSLINDNKNSKERQKEERQKIINQIADLFKANEANEPQTSEILKKKHLEEIKAPNYLMQFVGFCSSFIKYNSSRKYIYSSEGKVNSIGYRLVDENFPIFLKNIERCQAIIDDCPDALKEIKEDWPDILGDGEHLNNFNKCLTQSGIDNYNKVVGDINVQTNLYCQHHKELKPKKYKLEFLNKQILSDRTTTLEFGKQITDADVVPKTDAINQICKKVIASVLDHLHDEDNVECLIDKKDLAEFSYGATGVWDTIKNSLDESEVRPHMYIYELEKATGLPLMKGYATKFATRMSAYEIAEDEWNVHKDKMCFKSDSQSKVLKRFLESIMDIKKYLKPIHNIFQSEYDELKTIESDYNAIRNYVTSKSYSTEKIPLYFDYPGFLGGWATSTLNNRGGMIFSKDNKYYLGIKSRSAKVNEIIQEEKGGEWNLIGYNQIPRASLHLPRIFKKKGIMPDDLLKGCVQGKHVKENLDLKFLHRLIDFYKECIANKEDWKIYNFIFSPTESYENLKQFTDEVDTGAYSMWNIPISDAKIQKLVNEGKLYLFEIYNKGFSKASKGRRDITTLYLKQLFSQSNIESGEMKLAGNAEMFLRPSSINKQNAIVHREGMTKVRKTYQGEPIPAGIIWELRNYAKELDAGHGNPDKLSQVALEYLNSGEVVRKKFQYDVTKDKRFTEDQFELHIPMVFNRTGSDLKKVKINNFVNDYLRDHPDTNVIGIDRGEHNLLYYSVLDRNNNILEQGSLNIINGFNYQEKLRQVEWERKEARQNWQTVKPIKTIKDGYLSQAINEIIKLMKKYNAVIVLADLGEYGQGLKKERACIEAQVYQRFETVLINKLSFLTNKDEILKTNQIKSHTLASPHLDGCQNGVIFFVPASYTSKIDPVTGFVNLFKKVKKTQKDQSEFLSKLEFIRYNIKSDVFEFGFDYKNFKDIKIKIAKSKWVAKSIWQRSKHTKDIYGKKITEIIEPTIEIKSILKEFGVKYANGKDILPQILSTSKKCASAIYHQFMYVLSMRVTAYKYGLDDIVSPIADKNGQFFNSTFEKANLPINADANGAYNIARKGNLFLNKVIQSDKPKLSITIKDWLDYAQAVNA